jgi:energy-converting hydrogenase Eha subunit G
MAILRTRCRHLLTAEKRNTTTLVGTATIQTHLGDSLRLENLNLKAAEVLAAARALLAREYRKLTPDTRVQRKLKK